MKAVSDKVKILGHSAINAKLRRIAYQIYEKNYVLNKIVLIGIDDRGGYLAEKIEQELSGISPLEVALLNVKKSDSGIEVKDEARKLIKGQAVILVDDVLYSGKTMFHAIAEIMKHEPAGIQTMVLVDRGHRNLPVTHDYVGLNLATSLKQYVSMELNAKKTQSAVYLH